jgi:transcriptional regulator GlxA family with amidase domain
VSGAHFDRLRRFLMLLVDEISRPETPHLVIAELEDTFLMQFLAGNDHNHRNTLFEAPKQSAPRSVQRVEEYIAANWDKPFTIEQIAREFDMSARTIYATFKQHRGYGPKTFLRQTRLNKARELLRKSGMDVATVAKLCGFSNAGHFAHYYRTAFGELPSSTAR